MRIISLKEKQFKSGTVVQAEGTYKRIDQEMNVDRKDDLISREIVKETESMEVQESGYRTMQATAPESLDSRQPS